jgi:hypothetical protein
MVEELQCEERGLLYGERLVHRMVVAGKYMRVPNEAVVRGRK